MKNTLILACILLVLSLSVLSFDFSKPESNPQPVKLNIVEKVEIQKEVEATPEPKKEEAKKVTTTGCPKPKKEYKDETYLDVGQDVGVSEKYYTPSDLVKLEKSMTKYKDYATCLKKDASLALGEMIKDAEKDGHTIIASSGFRSYTTQTNILKEEIKKLGAEKASLAVAKPGYSEHQLGVAVDLTSESVAYTSAAGKFEGTPEDKWLEEHASEYGFIQSYPKGKESRTGYMYEPWHYRYVGIENAKEIIKNKQTINEFLKDLKEKTLQ